MNDIYHELSALAKTLSCPDDPPDIRKRKKKQGRILNKRLGHLKALTNTC